MYLKLNIRIYIYNRIELIVGSMFLFGYKRIGKDVYFFFYI